MKRAVILHGTDANPRDNWFPWLKQKFEAAGYEVWVPELPGNHAPNMEVYNDFLLDSAWDLRDNIIVGHSSGAIEIMNLLMDERCPKIDFGLLVSPWAYGNPAGDWEEGQFDKLFPSEGYDFERIKQQSAGVAILHNANDPFCPLDQAQYLAQNLDAELTVLDAEGHLSNLQLPEAWKILSSHLS